MRAFAALALLALALAAPGASALALPELGWYCIPENALCGVPEPPGFDCIPESVVCSPLEVACPRLGGTFGWCVRPTLGDPDGDGAPDQLNVTFVGGDWFGPRVSGEAGASHAPDAGASAGADACRRNLVVPLPEPAATPDGPCEASVDVTAGL